MGLNKYIYKLSNLSRKLGYEFHEGNDDRVLKMKRAIDRIGRVEFKIDQYPDGSWAAESTNIDGIITGGSNSRDISSTIKDAIFTYFEIPPHLCTNSLLKGDNEPVTVTRHVYA